MCSTADGCSGSLLSVSDPVVPAVPDPGVRGRGLGRARETVLPEVGGWCGLRSCELEALLPVVWGEGCLSVKASATDNGGRGGNGGVVQLLLLVPTGDDVLLAEVLGLGGRAGGLASAGLGGIAGGGAISPMSTVA